MRGDAFTVARLRLLYVAMNVCFYVRRPYFIEIRQVIFFCYVAPADYICRRFYVLYNKSQGGLFFLLSPHAAGTEVQLLIFIIKEKK